MRAIAIAGNLWAELCLVWERNLRLPASLVVVVVAGECLHLAGVRRGEGSIGWRGADGPVGHTTIETLQFTGDTTQRMVFKVFH